MRARALFAYRGFGTRMCVIMFRRVRYVCLQDPNDELKIRSAIDAGSGGADAFTRMIRQLGRRFADHKQQRRREGGGGEGGEEGEGGLLVGGDGRVHQTTTAAVSVEMVDMAVDHL